MEPESRPPRDGTSACVLTLSLTTILVIVVAGLAVHFLVDAFTSKVVLVTFVAVLIVLGIFVLLFLEIRRQKASRTRDEGARRWVTQTYEAQFRSDGREPRLPGPAVNGPSSWALFPRKWSTGTQLPPYSSPNATIRV